MGDSNKKISFLDLFDLDEIQKLQDTFANATGMASLIVDPEGQFITKPSNFCRLCEIIRNTEKGLQNCIKSDIELGRYNPDGPLVQQCLSGGLWDAGASIMAGDTYIASWLVGQVRSDAQNTEKMMVYAREIGADEEEFRDALEEVTIMPLEQFQEIANTLLIMANLLSKAAFQNMQQELTNKLQKEIAERENAERELALLKEKRERWEKYMIFIIEDQEYGVNLLKIQEVVAVMPITPIPNSVGFVKGVINLRGRIIPIIDLRLKLGLKEVEATEKTCIIIIHSEKQFFGIIVDSLVGVSNIKGEEIDEMPQIDLNLKDDYVIGMAKAEENIKILIDINQIVISDEISLLDENNTEELTE